MHNWTAVYLQNGVQIWLRVFYQDEFKTRCSFTWVFLTPLDSYKMVSQWACEIVAMINLPAVTLFKIFVTNILAKWRRHWTFCWGQSDFCLIADDLLFLISLNAFPESCIAFGTAPRFFFRGWLMAILSMATWLCVEVTELDECQPSL